MKHNFKEGDEVFINSQNPVFDGHFGKIVGFLVIPLTNEKLWFVQTEYHGEKWSEYYPFSVTVLGESELMPSNEAPI